MKKYRSTLGKLEDMLEDAINGDFREENYDESRLSRLEVRWKGFLSAQISSGQKVMEEREKIKSFISDISHQTKIPLSNIILYTQLLQEKETNPQLTEIVRNIAEQSERLEFLIQSLVKVSRLESEMLVLNPKRQPVLSMLKAAVESVDEDALKKQIRIQITEDKEKAISGTGNDVEACFDRKWTEEAIGNLLDNAVKYSPFGSEIKVSVKPYELFVAVNVTDTGIGIREEEQAQVFRRFYRSSEVAEEKGAGIGLYLVREIAERQNGYVKVKSIHGVGSTFSFYMKK